MNTQETLELLEKLRPNDMHESYQDILSMPVQEQPSGHHFLTRMVEAEQLERNKKRTEANIKTVKMRYSATFEHIK